MKNWFKYFGVGLIVLSFLALLVFLTLRALMWAFGEASGWWGIAYLIFIALILPTWVWLRSDGPLRD